MRVLLATDGSADAQKAAQWLRDFPLPPGATIRVVSVATFPHSPLDIPPVREFNQRLLEAAHQEIRAACERLGPRGVGAEARVMEGEPREALVREAAAWPADLVVVGARGLGPVGRFVLGSVSTAVVHGVHCPVAVVRGEARPLRRVVVACDGSPDAFAALRFLATLSLGPEISVRMLGVVPPPSIPPSAPELFAPPWQLLVDETLDERRAQLEGVLSRAEAELGPRARVVERSVVVGHPAAEILAAAAESGTDLVVLGARGLGPLGRLVLGSVSERVLHHAPGPVLIVKDKR